MPMARAQTFQPGYLVRAAGDTVRGELENAYWQDAPATIRFRNQGQTALQTLSTRSLQAFGLSGVRHWRTQYLTYDAAAESNPSYLQTDAPRTRFVTDTLVTEVLVQGPITLLAAFRGTTPHYFLLRDGQKPLELVDRRYQYTGPDGRRYLSRVNDYREQLRGFLPTCPEVAPRISRLPYDEKAIIRLVQQYNTTCLGQTIAATPNTGDKPKGQNRVRLDWGVQAGAAYTSTTAKDGKTADNQYASVTGPQQYEVLPLEKRYLSDAKLEQGLRPVVGIYADVLFPGRRLALHTDASFRKMQDYQQEFATGKAGYPTKTYRLSGSQTNLQIGIRALRPLPTGQFLAGLGLAMSFNALKENESAYPGATDLTYNGTPLRRSVQLDYPHEQVGLYAEIGYRWQRLTALLSWRYQEGLLDDRTAIESVVVEKSTNALSLYRTREYNLRSHLAVFSLGFRLNKNTD
ncbi:hypothetical protein PK28_15985 [Hymenobacter sp. DG25B]|nr:hypothetical protein PK28_15985 [Hymenobacter sp. DG25B]